MASHVIPNSGPHISTPATNRLLTYLDVLARRRPDTVAVVIAVRHGDNEPLLELVHAAQAGDADAAAIAVGALLPQLCKVVLNKERAGTWEASIDDYIALAYFTIAAVRPDETSAHLASKIISRTRLRHEWELETARRACPVTDGVLLRGLPLVPDIVGEVLGRRCITGGPPQEPPHRGRVLVVEVAERRKIALGERAEARGAGAARVRSGCHGHRGASSRPMEPPTV